MRKLIFADMFKLARIAKKVGFVKVIELQQDIAKEYDGKDGADMAYGARIGEFLLNGLDCAEAEIIEFISAVTGDTVDQVKEYSIEKVIETVKEIIEINDKEKLIGFFTSAVKE